MYIARKVMDGKTTRAEGARILSMKTGIPVSSAGIVIAAYLNISLGLVFKRTLSASDLEFFIASTLNDGNSLRLQNALLALRLHIEYRKSGGFSAIKSSAILEKYGGNLEEISGIHKTPIYLNSLINEFFEQVDVANELSSEERKKRLLNAPKHPKRVLRLVYVFERNADVVAEVLKRAQGYCEGCKKKAPFQRRSNGTAYLEVHHRQPLSEDGEDTVENAVALCPNCHRKSHFG